MSEFDYGTGRRKNATARTRLYAGNGAIEVNGRKVEDQYLGTKIHRFRFKFLKQITYSVVM